MRNDKVVQALRSQFLALSIFLGAPLCLAAQSAEAANLVAPDKRWPNNSIDVVICDGRQSLSAVEFCRPQKGGSKAISQRLRGSEAETIRAAIRQWNHLFAGNIALKEVESPSANSSLVFRVSSRPERCSTGRVGYSISDDFNFISIGARCNLQGRSTRTSRGAVVHEIMHAVGFYHEQERSDRAEFLTIEPRRSVRVAWSLECRRKVAECSKGKRGLPYGSYDFGSIMHYSAVGARARGSHVTELGLVALASTAAGVRDVGQREGLSQQDISAVRALYP